MESNTKYYDGSKYHITDVRDNRCHTSAISWGLVQPLWQEPIGRTDDHLVWPVWQTCTPAASATTSDANWPSPDAGRWSLADLDWVWGNWFNSTDRDWYWLSGFETGSVGDTSWSERGKGRLEENFNPPTRVTCGIKSVQSGESADKLNTQTQPQTIFWNPPIDLMKMPSNVERSSASPLKEITWWLSSQSTENGLLHLPVEQAAMHTCRSYGHNYHEYENPLMHVHIYI